MYGIDIAIDTAIISQNRKYAEQHKIEDLELNVLEDNESEYKEKTLWNQNN